MITYTDASGPVTGDPGSPDYGACRVCQYHDPATGALMYRIEKEATAPADEAELICIHVSAAYCRRLLAAMKSDMGGELGAKGAMLLIRAQHRPLMAITPAGHPRTGRQAIRTR